MRIVYLVFALLAILAAQAFLLRRFARRGLSYARAFSARAAFAGETVTMREVIRNAKPLPLPWLKAESRISPSLQFAGRGTGGELRGDGGDAYHRSVFFLAPYAQVTRTHTVRLHKRGRYEVGSVALSAGDLFGSATAAWQLNTGAAITVYPRLLSEGMLDIPASRWQGDMLVRRWIVPDPFLFSGIREFQAGDAERDVHWAATARTGRLQVMTRDYTASPKLLIILNVQMDERQWGELMPYEQDVVEQGVSLAATLLVKALGAGVEAGFAANAPMDDGNLPMVLPPARYAGREEDLLEALARLRIRRARSFQTFLEGMGHMTGMDMLILSAYDSALIREQMAGLRLRGNSVALVTLCREVSA